MAAAAAAVGAAQHHANHAVTRRPSPITHQHPRRRRGRVTIPPTTTPTTSSPVARTRFPATAAAKTRTMGPGALRPQARRYVFLFFLIGTKTLLKLFRRHERLPPPLPSPVACRPSLTNTNTNTHGGGGSGNCTRGAAAWPRHNTTYHYANHAVTRRPPLTNTHGGGGGGSENRARGVTIPPTTTPTMPLRVMRCPHPFPVAATEPGQQQRQQRQQRQQQ